MEEKRVDFDYMISTGDLQNVLIETRKKTGMNRKAFAEYFKIPYRTLQDWELGNRQMPEYLLRLMMYQLQAEGLFGNKKEGEE